MLWNIAYGTKQPKKANNKTDAYKPKNKTCTCLVVTTDEDEDRMNQYHDQLLLDLIRRRGGLKVKLRLNPQRGRSIADPDSPLVGIIDAMAEKKNVIVSAAKFHNLLRLHTDTRVEVLESAPATSETSAENSSYETHPANIMASFIPTLID
jgi:hypothetical protein